MVIPLGLLGVVGAEVGFGLFLYCTFGEIFLSFLRSLNRVGR